MKLFHRAATRPVEKTQPIDENENAVLMQTELRLYGLRESVLVSRLLVCMILLKV